MYEGARVRNVPFIIKVIALLTPALPKFMCFPLRAMLERIMSITDFPEEMNLILASEKGSTETVNRSISPSLNDISTGLD